MPRKAKSETTTATIDPADLEAHTPLPVDDEDWNSEPRIIPEVMPRFELEPEPDDEDADEGLEDGMSAAADDGESFEAAGVEADALTEWMLGGDDSLPMMATTDGGSNPYYDPSNGIPDAEDVYGDTQLNLADDLPFPAWDQLGGTLIRFEESNAWWLGDWALFGERHYGEEFSQALDAERYSKSLHTVQNYRWVADAIPPARRRGELSWTHHEIVASMTPEDQDLWLQRAVDEELSTRDLRKAIKDSQAIEVEHRPAADPTDEEPDELELVYGELYSAVQLVGKLAEELGYPAGARNEEDSPGFTTIYVDLPEAGQVSWQLPEAELRGHWADYGPAWDGHDADERARRIESFVEFGELAAEEDSHAIDPDDDLEDEPDAEPITREPIAEDHTQAGEDIDEDEIPFD
jgi:hypothetical protein